MSEGSVECSLSSKDDEGGVLLVVYYSGFLWLFLINLRFGSIVPLNNIDYLQ